jgi:hypothetical protein
MRLEQIMENQLNDEAEIIRLFFRGIARRRLVENLILTVRHQTPARISTRTYLTEADEERPASRQDVEDMLRREREERQRPQPGRRAPKSTTNDGVNKIVSGLFMRFRAWMQGVPPKLQQVAKPLIAAAGEATTPILQNDEWMLRCLQAVAEAIGGEFKDEQLKKLLPVLKKRTADATVQYVDHSTPTQPTQPSPGPARPRRGEAPADAQVDRLQSVRDRLAQARKALADLEGDPKKKPEEPAESAIATETLAEAEWVNRLARGALDTMHLVASPKAQQRVGDRQELVGRNKIVAVMAFKVAYELLKGAMSGEEGGGLGDWPPAEAAKPAENTPEQPDSEKIQAFVKKMTPEDRKALGEILLDRSKNNKSFLILMTYYVEGKSPAEIAAGLKMEEGAVTKFITDSAKLVGRYAQSVI